MCNIHSLLIDIFFSYVTFTFVIEAITITNSIIQLRKLERMKSVTRALKSVPKKYHFELYYSLFTCIIYIIVF
jgi:NAD/NADP transhydrogenase beta subunit